MYDGIDPSWPIKSKNIAGVLAIFFGGLGIHKFYLGKI
ncbi:NINE protein [Lysinibacillus sp. NPDC097231]